MKINFRRSSALVLLAAVPLSALLFGIGYLLGFDERAVFIAYAAVVVVMTACWVGYLFGLQRKLGDIEAILYEEKNPLSYIRETERFLAHMHSGRIRPLIWLNLSAGYAAMDVFNMADKILSYVNPVEMLEINQAIYYCSKAQYAFCRGNYSEGMAIVEERQGLLQKFADEPSLQCRIAIVHAFYNMAVQNWSEAERYAEAAENSCRNAYRMDFVLYLKMCLASHAKNYELAQKLYSSLEENGMTPVLKRMTSDVKMGRIAG